ncbi:polyprenyl synthetase family protein [Microbacterium excoecariae]|uniref:polyprenyl synthetase family protein n=1 Tax=Microbacterium excoecariae TaxID=2715210 RepID=UPI00140DB0C7|nr:polyprenyl synthetase family protein [Microbacterium excoecariae]
MTSSPAATGSQLASRFGLSDRVFVGPRARRLAETLETGLEAVEAAIAAELGSADPLVDAMSRYLYEAGGKRVRPMLVLLTAELGDGMTDAVRDAAVALELMHIGSLYHDDVMDGADRRRGVPAAHKVWDNSTAILAGDLLLARASRVMGRHGADAVDLQSETFERLVMGQLHETVGPAEGDDPIDFYIQVLADKTGSLIAAAAQAGAHFSGATRDHREALKVYGEKVGVAFQLADDVIDLSASPGDTGKVPGTDLRAGVVTMPYLLLQASTDPRDRDLTRRIDEGVERIREGADPAILDAELAELRDHAVTARTHELAMSWTNEAVDALSDLPRGTVREALTRFARQLADRSS